MTKKTWKMEFSESSLRELKKIDKLNRDFIMSSLRQFVDNFSENYEKSLFKSGKIKKMKGKFSNFYRLRLRNFRVIYSKEISSLILFVVRVGNRKDIYE